MVTTLFLRRGVLVESTTASHRGWSQTKLSEVSSSGMEKKQRIGGLEARKEKSGHDQGQFRSWACDFGGGHDRARSTSSTELSAQTPAR